MTHDTECFARCTDFALRRVQLCVRGRCACWASRVCRIGGMSEPSLYLWLILRSSNWTKRTTNEKPFQNGLKGQAASAGVGRVPPPPSRRGRPCLRPRARPVRLCSCVAARRVLVTAAAGCAAAAKRTTFAGSWQPSRRCTRDAPWTRTWAWRRLLRCGSARQLLVSGRASWLIRNDTMLTAAAGRRTPPWRASALRPSPAACSPGRLAWLALRRRAASCPPVCCGKAQVVCARPAHAPAPLASPRGRARPARRRRRAARWWAARRWRQASRSTALRRRSWAAPPPSQPAWG
jgi:hypothetical protein